MTGWEIRRQIAHTIFGTLFIALLFTTGKENTIILLSSLLGIGMIISFLMKKGYPLPKILIHKPISLLGRENEKIPGYGAMMLFTGAIISMAIFDQRTAIGALIVATYGDAASTMIGKAFGRHRTIGNYTAEGTIAGIAVSFFALSTMFSPIQAFLAATIGMLVELLPIDDNITIPIASGLVLAIIK